MRAHDFINEFAPGDGEDNGRKFIPWEDFVKHVANMVGDEFSVKMSKIPKQVKAVFTPHDVTKYGPTQIYAYWDRKGVAVHGGFQIGSYQKLDRLYTHYRLGKLGDSKYVDFTLANVSRFADIIKSNTDGALQPKLNESSFQEHEEQLRDFIKWCVRKLKIKQQLPRIRFQDAKEGPDQHRTGYYDDNDDIMWIYTGNRNLIDIMRTVAHELTHRKQHEADMVRGDQSYPGSPMEQQADAVAGYLMKLYGREHPEIIE